MKKNRNIRGLLQNRHDSVEQTRILLHQALDRFEHGQLIRLSKDTKLTVRNLAEEAGLSKDTPLSRYKKDQSKAGEYRFPDVVERFNSIKSKKATKKDNGNFKDLKIRELREIIKLQDEKIELLALSINKTDTENYLLKERNKELEDLNIQLRRESLKVIPFPSKNNLE
jgi:hypothetical protein